MGRSDILVKNHGVIRHLPALEFSGTAWDDVVKISLMALFFLSQTAALRMMTQDNGKIIKVASMLSILGDILVYEYTAVKGGVTRITLSMANEWATKSVNMNAITAKYMATDNTTLLRADPISNNDYIGSYPRWSVEQNGDLKGSVVFQASLALVYL